MTRLDIIYENVLGLFNLVCVWIGVKIMVEHGELGQTWFDWKQWWSWSNSNGKKSWWSWSNKKLILLNVKSTLNVFLSNLPPHLLYWLHRAIWILWNNSNGYTEQYEYCCDGEYLYKLFFIRVIVQLVMILFQKITYNIKDIFS